MVTVGQPPGNNPSSTIIVLHQRCLNCSECFQRHLMFYTCNYNIRVTQKWCLRCHFLHESDPRRDHHRLFFIHFVAPCACSSSSVNITSNFLLYEDLSTLALHTSVGWYFLQNASRTALCYATNTIK